MTDAPEDANPYAAPPQGWAPQPPPYAAPPGWQPPPPPYGAQPVTQTPPPGTPVDASAPPPYTPPPAWQQQAQHPPAQPYGSAPGWAPGYPPYGYPQPRNINGLAIASLVCSIVLSWLLGLGGILGVVFGIVALKQCAQRGERGRGLAIAGIVIGGIVIAFWILTLIVGVAVHHSGNSGTSLGALG